MRADWILAGLLSIALGAQAAHAQAVDPADPAAAQSPAPEATAEAQPVVDDKDKWQFTTIGYIWFAGAHGQTDVIGPVPPLDLDLSFGDVLKGFKFAFMGAAEARHDRFVVLGDLMFVHLEAKDGIGIRDPDFLKAELDSRTAAVTLLGGYRVVDKPSASVDLLAGGRFNFFRTSAKLDGPNRSIDGAVKQTWVDPVIAARAIAPLGGKWNVAVYGDIGGILWGSDFSWQGVATVNYQVSRKLNLGVGWRYFKVDYDKGDFLYDVGQNGPVIVFRSKL